MIEVTKLQKTFPADIFSVNRRTQVEQDFNYKNVTQNTNFFYE